MDWNITPVFQARWTKANLHLKPLPNTLLRKICQVAWNIISVLIPFILMVRLVAWGVAELSKRATLPSRIYYKPEQIQEIRDTFQHYCTSISCHESAEFRAAYTVQRHTVVTPDGARLAVLHFRHKESTPQTPTVLYCQPNLALSEQFIHSSILKETIKRDAVCNFVAFDYRGVSMSEDAPASQGLRNPEADLTLDGDSVYQFVRDELNVPVAQIHCHGWSLGGVVSANVKAIHPEWRAPYVNERSLSSTAKVVQYLLKGLLRLLLFWFPWAMKQTKWNFKTPLKKVEGPMMIVYSPFDETIPYAASTHHLGIQKRVPFFSVKLTPSSKLHLAETLGFKVYHHAHPLEDYIVKETVDGMENRPAVEIITDFLVGPGRKKAARLSLYQPSQGLPLSLPARQWQTVA